MRRGVAVAAASLAVLGGVAVASPAFAGTPVTATATVAQATTLTGITSSITLPSTAPGGTATADAAEAYTVATNDPAGYSLSLTDAAITACGSIIATFCNGGPTGIRIPGNLTVTETGANPGTVAFGTNGQGASGDIAKTTAMTAGDNYSENWALTIPTGIAAGNYTDTFTYAVVGN